MREKEGRSRADREREREREACKLKAGSGLGSLKLCLNIFKKYKEIVMMCKIVRFKKMMWPIFMKSNRSEERRVGKECQ